MFARSVDGRKLADRRLGLECLESRRLLAANLLITEFMADNDDNVALGRVDRDFGKPDPLEDGSTPDWIEIHNAGDEAINLQGYHLTDDADELSQWQFPGIVLEPDGYLLVFATGDGSTDEPYDSFGNLHTNFGLSRRGDYLALVAPDASTIVSELSTQQRNFPPQASDVSYGLAQAVQLITPQSDATYWVPQNGELGQRWTLPEFDPVANGFSAGQASLGYETRPDDRTNFLGQFETELPESTQAAFVRMEFDVPDQANISTLLLNLRYDNGFVAYINGVEVARDNVPDVVDWSSDATRGSRRDSLAMEPEEFDLSEHAGDIREGKNVLGIHLLNHSSDTTDLLLAVELTGDKPLNIATPSYLLMPTPGTSNALVGALAGPIISDVTENPGALQDDEDLLVTANVREHHAPIDVVSLQYRIMFDREVSVAMVDDGTNGDTLAGDGVYSASIPSSASVPGQMIRWRVTAGDANGDTMRWPIFADPDDSDQYFGTMVSSPVESKLRVLNWFIDDTNFRNAGTDNGGHGSLFFLDQFYDNIRANSHGQSTRNFPKRSYDLDFNQGNRFQWQDGESRVRDINLLTNWADKAKFRHALAYDMYRDAASPALFAFPVRVQRNGSFFSVADMVEDADDRTLERLGLNPDGALYKMYDGLNSAGAWEKKSRRWDDKTDLTDLRNATRLRGEDWSRFAFDNVDIPEFVNFLPLFDLQNNKGCCHKNYYLYRDTGNTDEWQIFIWDPDLAFGHDFKSGSGYFDDEMDWDNPLFSSRGTNNALLRKLYSTRDTPGFNEMYLRRLRTLMDEMLQPSDTPYEDRYLESRMDAYVALIDPNDDPFDETPRPPDWPDARHGVVLGSDDADLDYNTWGSWDHANGNRLYAARGETMREHAQRIKDEYLDQRRDFLYGLRQLPGPQIGNPKLDFGTIETESPDSAYIELMNPHDVAVDISGWQLGEAVEFTFPAGTVIPSGWSLYVVADKNAFRARTQGPSGGEGLFIVGGWDGELSVGETLRLTGADDALVGSVDVLAPRRVGDVNADGLFNSSDLVVVFRGGKYEDDIAGNATFDEGDWNLDGDFDTSDLVFAFQQGHYSAAGRSAGLGADSASELAAAIDYLFALDEDAKRKSRR